MSLAEGVLGTADVFHRSRANYPETAEKDIQDLGDESLTEAHIGGI